MIDGRQIRAARAMLGWSRDDLLKASGISMSALLRMEGALADSRSSTLNKVVKALSLAGIEFVTRDDGRQSSASSVCAHGLQSSSGRGPGSKFPDSRQQ